MRDFFSLCFKRVLHCFCVFVLYVEEPTEQPSFELNKEQRELQCNNEVQLLSVSHYLFIRHLAELFLTLKVFTFEHSKCYYFELNISLL